MNIVVLDAFPDGHKEFIGKYVNQMKERGHSLQLFELLKMDIHFCIGCWDCWWKTPGKCVFTDDMEKIYPAVLKSDLLVFASPVVMGFVNSWLKKVNDRMIPLLHPYIELRQKECHHIKRYSRYPPIGLALGGGASEEDIQIIEDIYRRLALDFHSELKFVITENQKMEEIIHVTCNI